MVSRAPRTLSKKHSTVSTIGSNDTNQQLGRDENKRPDPVPANESEERNTQKKKSKRDLTPPPNSQNHHNQPLTPESKTVVPKMLIQRTTTAAKSLVRPLLHKVEERHEGKQEDRVHHPPFHHLHRRLPLAIPKIERNAGCIRGA